MRKLFPLYIECSVPKVEVLNVPAHWRNRERVTSEGTAVQEAPNPPAPSPSDLTRLFPLVTRRIQAVAQAHMPVSELIPMGMHFEGFVLVFYARSQVVIVHFSVSWCNVPITKKNWSRQFFVAVLFSFVVYSSRSFLVFFSSSVFSRFLFSFSPPPFLSFFQAFFTPLVFVSFFFSLFDFRTFVDFCRSADAGARAW